jgi:hypothetical protein
MTKATKNKIHKAAVLFDEVLAVLAGMALIYGGFVLSCAGFYQLSTIWGW